MIASHRGMIDGMVELVKIQMELLASVDKSGADMEEYVNQLEGVLDMKEEMIGGVRDKLQMFQGHLKEEEELSMNPGIDQEEWLIE